MEKHFTIRLKQMYSSPKKIAINGALPLIVVLCLGLFFISVHVNKKAVLSLENFISEHNEINDVKYKDFSCSIFTGTAHLDEPEIILGTGDSFKFKECDFYFGDKRIFVSFNGHNIHKKVFLDGLGGVPEKIMADYPEMIHVDGMLNVYMDSDKKTLEISDCEIAIKDFLTVDLTSSANNIELDNEKTKILNENNIVVNNIKVKIKDEGFLDVFRNLAMGERDHISDKDFESEVNEIVEYYVIKEAPWVSAENRRAIFDFLTDPHSAIALDISNPKKFSFLDIQEKIMGSIFVENSNPFRDIELSITKI